MTMFFLIISILILLVIFFVINKRKSTITKKVIFNPAAQSTYNNKKNNQIKKLTLKEQLEQSWQFLYDITEIIMNKFSNEDKQELDKLGDTLSKTGMRYEHVIHLGIKPDVSRAQNQAQEQGQNR